MRVSWPRSRQSRLCEVGFRHRLGAGGDRLDDVLVAGAAAEIAFELFADGVLGEVMALAVDQIDGGHDHAGRTEAALQAMVLAEGLLHRMQRRAVGGQSLDGPDFMPVGHHHQRGAGLHRLTVEMHDAGAALRGIAADMGAGQPQVLAQELHQEGAGVDIGSYGITVHNQRNLGHQDSLLPALPPCTAEQPSKSVKTHNMGHPGNEQPRPEPEMASETSGSRSLHRLGKIGKELIGQLFGGPVDQALAELGELAADLGLDIISEKRAAILVGQSDRSAALGKAGDAALALARDLVAVWRIEIAQRDLALEARRHRPDLHFRDRAETIVVGLFQFLASGNAGLEHFRIVQLGPHRLARRWKLDFTVHRHGHEGLPGSLWSIAQSKAPSSKAPSNARAAQKKGRSRVVCDAYFASAKVPTGALLDWQSPPLNG